MGERFSPIANTYVANLRTLSHSIASSLPEFSFYAVFYTMVGGLNYVTRAELRFLRTIGTDAVGMSTVPEVIVARHAGKRVLGLSLITNEATGSEGSETEEVNHAEVLAAADAVRSIFAALVRGIVREITRFTSSC